MELSNPAQRSEYRIDTPEVTQLYFEHFNEVSSLFGISDSLLESESLSVVCHEATKLCMDFGIELLDLDDPVQSLLFLSIADSLAKNKKDLSERSHQLHNGMRRNSSEVIDSRDISKKIVNLYDLAKSLMHAPNKNIDEKKNPNHSNGSISKRLDHMSRTNKRNIQYFYPYREDSISQQSLDRLEGYATSNLDDISKIDFNRFVVENFSWETTSDINYVRKVLGLTEDTEKSISLEFVKNNKFPNGGAAFCISGDRNHVPIIVTTLNVKQYILAHEYAHSQSRLLGRGIAFGDGGLFFRGLNEAITENCLPRPEAYYLERRIFDYISMNIPNFRELGLRA